MYGGKVGVLEEGDEVRLGGLLERHDGRGLEAEVSLRGSHVSEMCKECGRGCKYLEVLSNFTDKTLEGQLADEELRALLVPPDLTKRNGTGAEAVRLLDTTSGGGLRSSQ